MTVSNHRYPADRVARLGGVLVTMLSLAACQQQTDPAPPQQAPDSKAPVSPVTQTPKVIERRMDEIDALDSVQLARFDRDEVERIEEGMACSIDSINTVVVGSAPVKSGSDLRISGWIAVGDAAPERVLAIFKGEQAFATLAQMRGDRPDIAQKANVVRVADVVAQSIAAEIPKGSYKVYFARKDASGWAKCVADSDVTVE